MGDRHGDHLFKGAPVLIYDARPGRVEKVFPRGRRYIVLVVSDVNGVPTLERIEVRGDLLTLDMREMSAERRAFDHQVKLLTEESDRAAEQQRRRW